MFFIDFSSPFAFLLSHVMAMVATAWMGATCDRMSHSYGRDALFLGVKPLQKISKKSEVKATLHP
ncbi:hypothetical protein IV02_21430 [Pseudomonas syringae]|uniref:Uncharacterized protein n=1 Tax=Pseudomonas syringae TaxID=317 RepID=A0A085UZM6_PSESX|nr:hypothetical protein IV02_21430 [Pseudomonas syringae]